MTHDLILIAALVGLVLLYQAATILPPRAAMMIAVVMFAMTHIAATKVNQQLIALHPEMAAAADPWAKPSRQNRRLADRGQQLALRQMNLRSMFPNAATRGIQLAERLGYA